MRRGRRHADLQQRAAVALRLAHRRRRDAGAHEAMQPVRRGLGELAEDGIESHLLPPAGLAIEQGTDRYGCTEHFFQTERLRAKLDFVRPMSLRLSTLVLDRQRPPSTGMSGKSSPGLVGGQTMKLHHVGLAGEAQPQASQRNSPGEVNVAAGLPLPRVDTLVQVPALDGERVLHPDLLEMNQRTLPLAKQQVLQGREREEVAFGEHFRSPRAASPPPATGRDGPSLYSRRSGGAPRRLPPSLPRSARTARGRGHSPAWPGGDAARSRCRYPRA